MNVVSSLKALAQRLNVSGMQVVYIIGKTKLVQILYLSLILYDKTEIDVPTLAQCQWK